MRTLDDLRRDLRTVVAIPVTPFDSNGGVDPTAYTDLVERTVRAGVRAVTPNGNTGEFYSLSPAERRRCVELTMSVAGDAVVVAGVGLDPASAVEETVAARDAGAPCVMVHQPVHPFRSLRGWVDYHRAISAAAPDMGIVPYVKDGRVDVAAMRALLDACPNIVAVKYAVADPAAFAAVVDGCGSERVSWLCGLAETWAPFFALGGSVGFTSGLVTLAPRLSLGMQERLAAGDHAGAMGAWRAAAPFEELRARNQSELNVSTVKEGLAQLGLCRRDVRPPIGPLERDDRAAVAKILADWGLTGAGTTS